MDPSHDAADSAIESTHRFLGWFSGADLSLRFSERRVLLAAGDVACWLIAAAVFPQAHRPGSPLLVGLAAAVVVWTVTAWVNGAYEVEIAAHALTVLPALARTALVTGAAMAAVAYFSYGSVGRAEWLASFLAGALAVVLWRLVYLRLFTLPMFTRRVLLTGVEPITEELAGLIRDRWGPQFAIAGRVESSGAAVSDLLTAARSLQVAEIVASPDAIASPDQVAALVDCVGAGVRVTPGARLYEELARRIPVSTVDHRWILDMAHGASPGRAHLTLKRFIDILLAGVGLCALALIGPLVAAAILVDSGRPVLYRQRRVGFRGQPFTIVKFRTMRRDAETGSARWARADDDRVTRVGRFLRRSRIDELPQVVSVLRGRMSVVGPRPERPDFVETLAERIPFYRVRHGVKPGLTGWAQINQGYSGSEADARIKLEYDLYYMRRQSLLFDALIVLRTIGTVLALRGR